MHEAKKKKKSTKNKINYPLKITLFRKDTHTQLADDTFCSAPGETTKVQMNELVGQGGNVELMALVTNHQLSR